MFASRWFIGLTLFAVTFMASGCGGSAPPPPEPEPAADGSASSDFKPAILPDIPGSLIRAEKTEAPPAPAPRPPRPGEIVLPEDGGTWPWNLPPSSPPAEARPVVIKNGNGTITGMAVRPEAGRAVVGFRVAAGKKAGDSEGTRMVLCDTRAGTVLTEWQVKGTWKPWDLSLDGRRILVCRDGANTRHDVLAVWSVGADQSLQRKSWQPHSPPEVGSDVLSASDLIGDFGPEATLDVLWAAWVGADRIVSASHAGQVRVFDANTLTQLGTIDAVPGRPAVTPDGKKVAFLVKNGVALFDPATCTITGTRRTGHVPPPASLAVSPNGQILAVGGSGLIAFLDLSTGGVWDTAHPKPEHDRPHALEPFAWAGNQHLFAGHFLYDLHSPIPVWDYAGIARGRWYDQQMWVVIKGFDASATLRPFELPHPSVDKKLQAELAKPEFFALRPGDGVRVDVSGVPADKRAEVVASLERRLQVVGYRSDPKATAVLFASEDAAGKPATANYSGHKPTPYTYRPARLKLMKGEKVLWEQAWAIEPPLSAKVAGSEPLTDLFQSGRFGEPNYRLFSAAPIPAMFRGPRAPIFAFGASELQSDGIQDQR